MPRYTVRFADAMGEVIEARNYLVGGFADDEEWTVFFGEDGREVARFKSDRIHGIIEESASKGPSIG